MQSSNGAIIAPVRETKALIDVQGRPLGEASAPPELFDPIATVWKVCPYNGVRKNHAKPMNATALRQVMSVWAESLSLAGSLRDGFLARWPLPVLTAPKLWAMSYIGALIPYYMAHRPAEPFASDRIPVVPSALFKVLAGVFQAAGHAALLDAARGILERSYDGAELLAIAEQEGVFESARGVCAGPPEHILVFLNVLLQGKEEVPDQVR